jgi:hypothetical protein
MLKATTLKSNESQKKAFSKEIKGILGQIDDELKLAHDQGKHRIYTTLPITFSIPYMSNSDAQRIIYYKVLSSLLGRGFNVSIDLKKDSTVFEITWLSNDEFTEIELQNTLLAKHSKKDLSKVKLDNINKELL